jgi:hypothetical protein
MSEQKFNQYLLESIDETLSSLGVSSKKAIYYHLKKSFKIDKQEIPYRIDAFSQALEKIFGFGASSLEILVLQKLNRKIGMNMKERLSRNRKFSISIELAKQYFTRVAKGINEQYIQPKEIMI